MYSMFMAFSGLIPPRDFPTAADSPGNYRWVQNKDSSNNDDGSYHLEVRVFNNSGGALVKGRPYVIVPTGIQSTNLAIITPAALAAVPRHVVFAIDASADQTYCWVAAAGWVDANVTGAQTIGAFLKIVPGTSAVALVTDGTTQTTATLGVVATTRASGTGVDRVFFTGDPIVVA